MYYLLCTILMDLSVDFRMHFVYLYFLKENYKIMPFLLTALRSGFFLLFIGHFCLRREWFVLIIYIFLTIFELFIEQEEFK